MALKSILGNWILAGGVIGGFVYLYQTSGNTSVEETDTPVEEQETAADEPEDETLNTTDEEPLRFSLPEIDFEFDGPFDTQNSVFPSEMAICGSMSISNAPAASNDLVIERYRPFVNVDGVQLATAPVEAGCFSSGFGPRGNSLHKGIDYHNPAPVEIYTAAKGIVREKLYRDDYGNMVVIDHGSGVFTRYAHLSSFTSSLGVGQNVDEGAVIGMMGNSAGYSIPIHLHYEVLIGEWADQAGSFGLVPVNIFARLDEN